MKRWTLACALSVGLIAAGCGNDEASGGTGGAGGVGGMGGGEPPTETMWSASDIQIPEDTCDVTSDFEEGEVFTITTSGSTATIESDSFTVLSASTDMYSPELTLVEMTGSEEFNEPEGCVVESLRAYALSLDDPAASLPGNDSLTVTLEYAEEDISGGNCEGVYIIPLPCLTTIEFTLTQTL